MDHLKKSTTVNMPHFSENYDKIIKDRNVYLSTKAILKLQGNHMIIEPGHLATNYNTCSKF